MLIKHPARSVARAALWLTMLFAVILPSLHGQTQGAKTMPLRAENFKQAAPRGFGDRNNSWAQAMVWWRGHLYIGASRQAVCTSLYALWQYVALFVS